MKKYTIQMPDGGFTKGPMWGGVQSVPMEKAKLWNARGHLTVHLDHFGDKYPAGSKIVEVEVVTTVTPIDDVATVVAERLKQKEQERKQYAANSAKARFEAAQRELERAKAALEDT